MQSDLICTDLHLDLRGSIYVFRVSRTCIVDVWNGILDVWTSILDVWTCILVTGLVFWMSGLVLCSGKEKLPLVGSS